MLGLEGHAVLIHYPPPRLGLSEEWRLRAACWARAGRKPLYSQLLHVHLLSPELYTRETEGHRQHFLQVRPVPVRLLTVTTQSFGQ